MARRLPQPLHNPARPRGGGAARPGPLAALSQQCSPDLIPCRTHPTGGNGPGRDNSGRQGGPDREGGRHRRRPKTSRPVWSAGAPAPSGKGAEVHLPCLQGVGRCKRGWGTQRGEESEARETETVTTSKSQSGKDAERKEKTEKPSDTREAGTETCRNTRANRRQRRQRAGRHTETRQEQTQRKSRKGTQSSRPHSGPPIASHSLRSALLRQSPPAPLRAPAPARPGPEVRCAHPALTASLYFSRAASTWRSRYSRLPSCRSCDARAGPGTTCQRRRLSHVDPQRQRACCPAAGPATPAGGHHQRGEFDAAERTAPIRCPPAFRHSLQKWPGRRTRTRV